MVAAVVPLMGAAFAEPDLLLALRREMDVDDPAAMGASVLTAYLLAERDGGRVRAEADCSAAASLVVGRIHDLAFQRYLFGNDTPATVPDDELALVVAAIT